MKRLETSRNIQKVSKNELPMLDLFDPKLSLGSPGQRRRLYRPVLRCRSAAGARGALGGGGAGGAGAGRRGCQLATRGAGAESLVSMARK